MKHIILSLAALCCGAALAQQATFPAASSPQPATEPRVKSVPLPPTQAERPTEWAKGNPAFPAPAGLTEAQAHAWDHWTSAPGFKSISIIQINPAILQSPSIALNIKGKTYVFNGKATRYEGAPTSHNGVPTGSRTPGGIRWQSEPVGKDGQGSLQYSDTGSFVGEFFVRGVGYFKVIGGGNVVFVVELDPPSQRRGVVVDLPIPTPYSPGTQK